MTTTDIIVAPKPAQDLTARVRALNDWLRLTGRGGRILITPGIVALGVAGVRTVLSAVAAFDAFTHENDPHGEHDFGSVDAAGERLLFKIDYYDHSLTAHSPDPADPRVTCRVLTIMLVGEY